MIFASSFARVAIRSGVSPVPGIEAKCMKSTYIHTKKINLPNLVLGWVRKIGEPL